MFEKLRPFLQHRVGQATGLALFAVAVSAAGFSIANTFGSSPGGSASRDRTFICAETGASFTHRIDVGDGIPVHSPHSGSDTGYPAEFCYWTADGQTKQQPTAVLLNHYVDKPGPTFCTDCDRLVVLQNPVPYGPSPTCPPTRAHLASR